MRLHSWGVNALGRGGDGAPACAPGDWWFWLRRIVIVWCNDSPPRRVHGRAAGENATGHRRTLQALVIIGFIVLSVLFANSYTAVVSLGLISLILGFALQTPITSFIAGFTSSPANPTG